MSHISQGYHTHSGIPVVGACPKDIPVGMRVSYVRGVLTKLSHVPLLSPGGHGISPDILWYLV